MPTFNAIVKSQSGETETLVRKADSQPALLKTLRAEGLVPVSVEEVSQNPNPGLLRMFRPAAGRLPRRKDLHTFMLSFATLLRAGMDLDRCLRTLERDSREPLRSVIAKMLQNVRHGESLSNAMEQANVFSPFHTRVIRAGEHGGNIHRAFARIATAIEREIEARGRIRNAIAYPAFLVVFGLVSFVCMLLFILPKFTGIYKEMGTDLPFLTRLILKGSVFLQTHAVWLLPTVGLLLFVAFRRLRAFRHSITVDRWRMKIPGLGPLIRDMQSMAFLRTFALLLQSGLTVTEALHVCSKVANSAVFADAAITIEAGVQRGGKISAEMRRLGLFSETILNLLAVGEESGRLEELMLETSDEMEKRMDQLVRGAISLLEPALILVIGAIIGLMVIAMLLPIFSLSSGLRR